MWLQKIKKIAHDHNMEIIIFGLALIARVIIFYFIARSFDFVYKGLTSDGYLEIAHNLVTNGIFSRNSVPPILPDSIRTPGLPLLIAASLFMFKSVVPFLILQMIVGSIIPLIGRKIAINFGIPVRWANIIAFFLAVEPMALSLSVRMMTETFFTFFFLLFVFYILKFLRSVFEVDQAGSPISLGNAAWGGVVLGMATQFRPTTLYLPIILIVLWILYRIANRRRILVKQVLIFLLFFNILYDK